MQQAIIQIAEKLKKIDRSCYAVGSYCVHTLLGVDTTADIDLTTDATPEEIAHVLTVVWEIGKKYGTLLVRESGHTFEITTFRKDIGSVNHRRPAEVIFTRSLAEDARRRDFTINAIYYDIIAQKFIDPVGGISDLNNKIIRYIWEPTDRLDEDILRLLRYVRFRFAYGFTPASKSYDTICKKRLRELQDIAIERIRQEFDKMLLSSRATTCLKYLKKIGFFKIFLDEVDALSLTPGWPMHHLEWDVWKHTLLVIRAMNRLLSSFWTKRKHSEESSKNKGSWILRFTQDDEAKTRDLKNKSLLYWSVLLHDIGKAPTFSKDANGNVHYFDHERIGADMISEIARRWKFSVSQKEKLIWLVKHHLHPQKLDEMKRLKVNRLMMHPLFIALLMVCMADGSGKKPVFKLPYKKIMQRYHVLHEKLKVTKFLSGNDIMYRYPDLTGPEIGKKLEELNNQILARL